MKLFAKYFVATLTLSLTSVTAHAAPLSHSPLTSQPTLIAYAAGDDTKLEIELANAAARGRTTTVQKLLNQGVSADSTNAEGWPAVVLAARNGYVDTVLALLEKGAGINAATPDGQTALMIATRGGHVQTVRTLLDRQANVQARTRDGHTALSIATKFNYSEIIDLLKAAGA
jgi:ankyrin repeat protein